MLSENDIAQKLRQNLPEPYTTDLAPVVAPTANDGQATIAPYPLYLKL